MSYSFTGVIKNIKGLEIRVWDTNLHSSCPILVSSVLTKREVDLLKENDVVEIEYENPTVSPGRKDEARVYGVTVPYVHHSASITSIKRI